MISRLLLQGGGIDKVTYHMLKTWRDEDKGKAEQLYLGLMVRPTEMEL